MKVILGIMTRQSDANRNDKKKKKIQTTQNLSNRLSYKNSNSKFY
jgi:hypothetical protein